MKQQHRTGRRRGCGFTLVEIMIVVVIIGLLATIAIPAFNKIRERTLVSRTINDLRIFRAAIDNYTLEHGDYPEDSNTGSLPPELEGYFPEEKFTEGTPVGGEWDVEFEDSGTITSAIGVHIRPFSERTVRLLVMVDESIDDGLEKGGSFQRLEDDRYYWIIEE